MSVRHLPTLLILLPLAGVLLVLVLPRGRESLIRVLSLAVGVAELGLALVAYSIFDGEIFGPQMEYRRLWIRDVGVQYHVGMDGVSLLLVTLTALLLPVAQLASWREVRIKVKEFSATLLAVTAGAIAAFVALDLAMFYICLEITLLPLFLLIGVWGGEGRVYAAVKFALVNIAGSALIIFAIVYLAVLQTDPEVSKSFGIAHLSQLSLSPRAEFWLLTLLFLGFAVKAALFPFHTWLADVHRHAPTAGSIITSGIWLNLGIYGILKFCLPLFTEPLQLMEEYLALLAIGAILYGGLLALSEFELPRLLAFATVSQIGLITLGFSTLTVAGVGGGVVHMVNRGVLMAGLFAVVGILRARGLEEERGLVRNYPRICAALLVLVIASVGVPGLNAFAGHISIVLGAVERNIGYAIAAVCGLLLVGASLLRRYQSLALGAPTGKVPGDDLRRRELAVLVPLFICILWIGLNPRVLLDKMAHSVEQILVSADIDRGSSPKMSKEGGP